MRSTDSFQSPQEFAEWVIRKLAAVGYQALFAGGCVRDQLMGRPPKDYDVATSALPDQVREVFGRKRTISVGASFGVITVIGDSTVGNVEVATFRCDGQYTDGRRPDHVTFTDARHDALRRDFTINGLFFDPINDQVLDFVNGQNDIKLGLIRAIGNPTDRFDEDKLRMLRAVRFATTLNFEIDQQTQAAIVRNAEGIRKVSGERVAAEMLKVLQSPARGIGLQLLTECQLAPTVLPELSELSPDQQNRFIEFLKRTTADDFAIVSTLSLLLLKGLCLRLENISVSETQQHSQSVFMPSPGRTELLASVKELAARWKLSNDIRDAMVACLSDFAIIVKASHLPWSQVQPNLIGRWALAKLAFSEWVCNYWKWPLAGIQFCKSKLQLPAETLDPPPLMTGNQLQAVGIPKGPELGVWLRKLRAMQLDGQLLDSAAALNWVKQARKRGLEALDHE